MAAPQYAIMRFMKYKGPEIGKIEAHDERTKRFLRMATQLLPSRIWPVRVKTAKTSGRMRRRPSAIVS